MSGILYIVATPIGNLEDISQRAIRTLKEVDKIAAEDTRHSSRLLQSYGITTPLIALHEHNERERGEHLLDFIAQGKSLALITDAGTPLISDPGYYLVRMAHQRGIKVVPIPGASALITALSAAGLPSDRFVFEGFLPAKSKARCEILNIFVQETRTVIFYEAPHRILECLQDMQQVFGSERWVVLARELTKTFETICGDTLPKLIAWLEGDLKRQKGEFVIVLAGAEPRVTIAQEAEMIRILDILLAELPLKQAAQIAAKITGIKKNQLYEIALARTKTV